MQSSVLRFGLLALFMLASSFAYGEHGGGGHGGGGHGEGGHGHGGGGHGGGGHSGGSHSGGGHSGGGSGSHSGGGESSGGHGKAGGRAAAAFHSAEDTRSSIASLHGKLNKAHKELGGLKSSFVSHTETAQHTIITKLAPAIATHIESILSNNARVMSALATLQADVTELRDDIANYGKNAESKRDKSAEQQSLQDALNTLETEFQSISASSQVTLQELEQAEEQLQALKISWEAGGSERLITPRDVRLNLGNSSQGALDRVARTLSKMNAGLETIAGKLKAEATKHPKAVMSAELKNEFVSDMNQFQSDIANVKNEVQAAIQSGEITDQELQKAMTIAMQKMAQIEARIANFRETDAAKRSLAFLPAMSFSNTLRQELQLTQKNLISAIHLTEIKAFDRELKTVRQNYSDLKGEFDHVRHHIDALKLELASLN